MILVLYLGTNLRLELSISPLFLDKIRKMRVPNRGTVIPNQGMVIPNRGTAVPNQRTVIWKLETSIPNQRTVIWKLEMAIWAF